MGTESFFPLCEKEPARNSSSLRHFPTQNSPIAVVISPNSPKNGVTALSIAPPSHQGPSIPNHLVLNPLRSFFNPSTNHKTHPKTTLRLPPKPLKTLPESRPVEDGISHSVE
ncbi:hypothetical protein BH09VER1_BH09VER1_06070 [soil metagenome]